MLKGERVSINTSDEVTIPSVVVLVAVLASVITLATVLSLCGGCTPMEVGSEDHAASGGHKSHYSTAYSGPSTDVTTRVMMSGTSLPNDPYTPGAQPLPYNPHPQTATTFTGYQSQGQAPFQAQSNTAGQGQGYSGRPAAQQPNHGSVPGANRHISDVEPPPPSYDETVQNIQGHQPSAPSQQYGW